MFEVLEELPIFALSLQTGRQADAHRLEVGVMMLAGMIIRPTLGYLFLAHKGPKEQTAPQPDAA
jgi:hypothetical protein